MGRVEEEIMGRMEKIILMQKIENKQYNCLVMIEKSIKGTWAYDFWTDAFESLNKKYNLIKNREG